MHIAVLCTCAALYKAFSETILHDEGLDDVNVPVGEGQPWA